MKIDLKGNTSQEGTPTPSSPIPVNVVSGDNEIVVCDKNVLDTSNTKTSGWNIYGIPNTLKPNTKYTFSIQGTTNYSYSLFTTRDTNSSTTITWLARYYINGGNSVTFTTPADMSNELGLLLGGGQSGASSESIENIKPQIEFGEVKTDYEEHKEQTYPINLGSMELCKIGDYQDYIAKSTGKNLFDKNAITESKIINRENGNADDSTNYDISDYIQVEVGSNYTFNNFNRWYSAYYDSNKNYVGYPTNTGTITIPSGVKYIRLSCLKTNIDIAQFEKGSSATSYEPYGKVWYKYGAIGKVVLDGSESWNRESISGGSNYYIKINDAKGGNDNVIYNNLGSYYNSVSGQVNAVCFISVSNNLNFRYDDTTTVNDFKTLLNTTNMVVIYQLATPTNTLIEDTTLIEQLEELKLATSYEGQTNISQENNDKPFILDVTALGELEI
jgi:hypothetical protein